MTFISMCDDLVTKFKASAQECLDKSVGGQIISLNSTQFSITLILFELPQVRRPAQPTPVPAGPTPASIRPSRPPKSVRLHLRQPPSLRLSRNASRLLENVENSRTPPSRPLCPAAPTPES